MNLKLVKIIDFLAALKKEAEAFLPVMRSMYSALAGALIAH